MNISTKLRLAVFVPVIMALVILIALAFSYRDMQNIQATGDLVRQVRTSITELNHFVFSYALYYEERPKQQFLAEYETLAVLLANTRAQTPEQQLLLDSIQNNSVQMKDLFLQLVANFDKSNSTGTHETLDRLTGSLLLHSYEADSNASALRRLVDEGIRITAIRTTGLIFLVIILVTIPLTVVLSRTRRSILFSLSDIGMGAAVIGAGNLDYQIEAKTKDEIGNLAGAFNQMTTNLKTVTASKKDLEIEVEERKKAEAALRESEQRWAVTLSSIGDAVIATDVNSRITFMNAVAETLTGWRVSEAIAKPISEIFHIINENTRQKADSPVDKVLEQGIICGLANHTLLVRKDGSELAIDDSGAPIKTQDGQTIGVVLIFRDITERRQVEASLKQYTSELETTNKELESFSYSVSHDLRAPLRTLDGFSEAVLLDYGDKLDETGKDYLNRVRNASQMMSQLIDDMLKLSRITRAEMHRVPVNLSDLATSIAGELKATQPDRQVEFVIAAGAMANGDRNLLQIGLVNLLENAWKYTSKCEKANIEFGLTRDNAETIYFIRDNGTGFDIFM